MHDSTPPQQVAASALKQQLPCCIVQHLWQSLASWDVLNRLQLTGGRPIGQSSAVKVHAAILAVCALCCLGILMLPFRPSGPGGEHAVSDPHVLVLVTNRICTVSLSNDARFGLLCQSRMQEFGSSVPPSYLLGSAQQACAARRTPSDRPCITLVHVIYLGRLQLVMGPLQAGSGPRQACIPAGVVCWDLAEASV